VGGSRRAPETAPVPDSAEIAILHRLLFGPYGKAATEEGARACPRFPSRCKISMSPSCNHTCAAREPPACPVRTWQHIVLVERCAVCARPVAFCAPPRLLRSETLPVSSIAAAGGGSTGRGASALGQARRSSPDAARLLGVQTR